MHSSVTAGGRGQSAPQTLLTGKFLLTYQEKRGKEKRENGEEKKENQKREGGKLKWKEENEERAEGFPPPFFSLFKTTEICFGSTKMGIFYQEKEEEEEKKNHTRKRNQDKWLCPLWKIFLLPSGHAIVFLENIWKSVLFPTGITNDSTIRK